MKTDRAGRRVLLQAAGGAEWIAMAMCELEMAGFKATEGRRATSSPEGLGELERELERER